MKITRFSVNRPIFTGMTACLVIILGCVALYKIPVDLLPEIEKPSLNVRTYYENATPLEIEESITRPLEQSLSAVSGVREIRSTSMEDTSSIDIDFEWGVNIDAATSDVRDRIDRIFSQLPDGVDRPYVRKFDSAAMPVVMLGFHSDMDLLLAREFVEDNILYHFERLPGVASVTVSGGLEREIQVELDMDKIKALNISFNDLLDRITKGNINTPGGNIEEGNKNIRVRIPGTFANLDELRETVVFYANGAPVILREIADIWSGSYKAKNLNRIDSKDSIQLIVYKQSGSNSVSVADAVLAEAKKLNRDLANGKISMLFDSSEYIRQSITNVTTSGACGGILAIFVLLFFLRNVRSTFVIAVSIPVSIVACFVLIYFAGFTINIMSLGGLALGIGMLVDNSIVVLENIIRKKDQGETFMEAAIDGAGDVSSPILASTLTTAVVFLPLLFITGMAGVLFRQLAVVVAFSLFCSYIAALTLVPMMSSQFLKQVSFSGTRPIRSFFIHLSEKTLKTVDNFYCKILDISLRHRFLVIISIIIIFAGCLVLIPYVGTELMPVTDESEVRISFEMESGTRLDVLKEKITQMENIIRDNTPELRIMQVSGGSGGWHAQGSHQGTFRVKLIPRSERSRSSQEIALALGEKLKNIPGLVARSRVRSSIIGRIIGGTGDDTIDIDIRGHDFDAGQALTREIVRRFEMIPGVTDVEISLEEGVPERNIKIDRSKAADLRLSVNDIAEALRTVLAGKNAGDYRVGGKEHSITVRVKNADKMSITNVLDLNILNREGRPVTLKNVLDESLGTGPSAINRKDRERVITVSVNAPGYTPSVIIDKLRRELSTLPLPEGFTILFSGHYEEQQKSFDDLFFSLILALVLVYIVMACQFESLKEPLIVMFSIPLAVIGVVFMLLLTNTTFNLQSVIGCIMLVGIVVNNAILLVDRTNKLRKEGVELMEAVRQAGHRRLRPILMTTLTTCLALLPMALGIGDGGEAQAPMARAVIGGLLSSTLITLILIPILYSVTALDRKKTAAGK